MIIAQIVITLPPFLSLLGIIFGGIVAGMITFAVCGVIGFMFADSHDFGSTMIFLAPWLGVAVCIAGWIFLPQLA